MGGFVFCCGGVGRRDRPCTTVEVPLPECGGRDCVDSVLVWCWWVGAWYGVVGVVMGYTAPFGRLAVSLNWSGRVTGRAASGPPGRAGADRRGSRSDIGYRISDCGKISGSFIHLYVKRPNTMRRGISHVVLDALLVVPGAPNGNTAGFRQGCPSRSPEGVVMSSLPSFLFLLGRRLASTTGGLALGAPSRAFSGYRLAPRLARALALLCALAERT